MRDKSRKLDVLQKDDDFLETMKKVFSLARFIGISESGLNVAFFWTVSLLTTMLVMETVAIWKIIKMLGKYYGSAGGLVGRLSGSIFYGNAILSLIFSVRFISSWNGLSCSWSKMNTASGLDLPPDTKIRKRVVVITCFVFILACVEHILSMMSATEFDIPPDQYFYRYIVCSHEFLIESYEYTLWLAIPIFIVSKVATMLWNFQDLIIILISMGLASRYHRLNLYVEYVIRYERKIKHFQKSGMDAYIQVRLWRRLREAYVRQADLVRRVDRKLGALVVLSNVNNLYFICLQLFLGFGQEKGTLINRFYYFLSLGWLLFRSCSVVLAASDISLHSKRALNILYNCPSSGYNIEITRLIYQLANDDVSLTGMRLFSLNRNLLLQVAANILKYELVLLQYDNN